MDSEEFTPLNKSDYKKLSNVSRTDLNQNHLMLSFIGFDCLPEEITQQLNLKPTEVGLKGQKNSRGRIYESSFWRYEWRKHTNDFIEDMVNDFFEQIITPQLQTLIQLSHICEITRFTLVQYYYTGNNLGYCFSKDQIQQLAALQADVDIDVYCLAEDE
jgi:hypothetical protein